MAKADALTMVTVDYLLGLPGPFSRPEDLDIAVTQLGEQLIAITDLSIPEYAGPGIGMSDTCGLCRQQFDLMYEPDQYPTVHNEGTDTWDLICDSCQAVMDEDERYDGCTCCRQAGCHRGPGSECPCTED